MICVMGWTRDGGLGSVSGSLGAGRDELQIESLRRRIVSSRDITVRLLGGNSRLL